MRTSAPRRRHPGRRAVPWYATAAGAVLAVLLAACGTSSAADPAVDADEPAQAAEAPEEATPTQASDDTDPAAEGGADPSPTDVTDPSPPATPAPTEGAQTGVDGPTDAELAAAGVNELGRIPVIEWHKIQDVDGRWENSLSTFRDQLRRLHERGYRPISIAEFASGRIDVPFGLSPVLLTFDDSYKEHMFFDESGERAHPDSVPGILAAMAAEDPTWRPRASFAFYWPYPFRETDPEVIAAKLRWLHANGFDLSNHSETHDDLRALGDAGAIRSLARAEMRLQEVVPDARLHSLTLPFGVFPNDESVAVTGTFEGHTYVHDIVLLVGFQPTRSPHHVDYDPTRVQRVQAWVEEFDKWLAWLDEEPGRRFVSDGDPDVATYPAGWADVAAPRPGVTPRSYEVPQG